MQTPAVLSIWCRLLLVAGALMSAIACDDVRQKAVLDELRRAGVREDEAASRLNMKFEVRERGTRSWEDMERFLAQEPLTDYRPLREAVKKYPRILYHTTMWQMTWLFVDKDGIVRDYYVTSQ